jgi:hypothetical protein
MTALGCIASENPKEIYSSLSKIIVAANSGSVITKDHAVNILITLCAEKKYADKAFPLLMEQLLNSPANQLPSYAEKGRAIVTEKNKARFIKILSSRLNDIEKDTKRRRVEKVIRKFL